MADRRGDLVKADALRLSVYFGDSVTSGPALSSDALMACFADHGLASATLLRGIEGFGINRRIQAERFPDASTDLPLLAVAVDTRERIRSALDDVDLAVPRGLVTLEQARLATGRDVRDAELRHGPGGAAKLTIYCASGERVRRRPSYREAVALLRRNGAAGATVLTGVDGLVSGRRRRVGVFSSGASAPTLVVSVGRLDALRRSLPGLAEMFESPVVTLEPIAQLKHDGEPLEPLPTPASRGVDERAVWQAIHLYARRSAQVGGRALHSELVRRLREAGAAGATTILGDWGFSADERPYGDRLGRVTSHRPTYTVYVDSPAKVAETWPLIDELTGEHGLVTSRLVPGYRERAGDVVRGSLG
jgi:PII-like signaling protein